MKQFRTVDIGFPEAIRWSKSVAAVRWRAEMEKRGIAVINDWAKQSQGTALLIGIPHPKSAVTFPMMGRVFHYHAPPDYTKSIFRMEGEVFKLTAESSFQPLLVSMLKQEKLHLNETRASFASILDLFVKIDKIAYLLSQHMMV